jgi:hypothetical protein
VAISRVSAAKRRNAPAIFLFAAFLARACEALSSGLI